MEKDYIVTISYKLNITAKDEEEAENLAFENLNYASPDVNIEEIK